MKPSAPFLATLLLASSALTVHAGTGTHSLGATTGFVAPMGDLADAVGAGWFLGATYNYRFNARWAAGVDLDYFSFGEKDIDSASIGGATTVKGSAHGGQSQFYGKYYLPVGDGPIEPYVKAGYFHHRIGFKETTTQLGSTSSSTDKEMDSGFGFGVGASQKVKENSVAGLEFLYSRIETSPNAAEFLQIGLSYCRTFGG